MNILKKCMALLVVLSITGCAGGLNSMQKREYVAFENEGVLVEEKNPTVGTLLGILPGFGSFYVGEIGYGVANLLLWPASILWDPISGHNGSMSINYDLTRHQIKKQKQAELSSLDDQLGLGKIDNSTYIIEKRKIENKYNYQ